MFADRQFYTSISTGILHASASERRRKKLGGTHCGGLEINSHSHFCPRHVLWMEWLSTPPEHPDLLLFPSLLPCHGDDEQHRTDKTNQTGENAKLKRRLSSRFHATFLACLNVCSLTTTTTTEKKKKKNQVTVPASHVRSLSYSAPQLRGVQLWGAAPYSKGAGTKTSVKPTKGSKIILERKEECRL